MQLSMQGAESIRVEETVGTMWPVSSEALSLSFFHLTHLTKAGVGLDDALHEVQMLEPGGRLRRLWRHVAEGVRSGESLSMSMSLCPAAFDEVIIALIRAGEINGELENACASCCEVLDWNTNARSRLVSALLYPIFALLVLTAVVIFLFVAVVPSLEGFLNATQSDMAWHTRGLLLVSDYLGRFHIPLATGMAVIIVSVLVLRRLLHSVRLATDSCLLRLPLIGKLLLEISLSRYAGICGRLYRSGIDLNQSLLISESVIGNVALKRSFRHIRSSLIAGSSLSEALKTVHRLPTSFHRLLAAGESAGALGQAFSQAGDQHQRHATLQLDRLERMAGPLTLTIVGLNLLWIIVSVLGPVYESAIDAVLLS